VTTASNANQIERVQHHMAMNPLQAAALRALLQETGCASLAEWLDRHGDDLPQVGICRECGWYDWDCDPDTHGEYCPTCERSGCYSSLLAMLGLI